MSSSTPHDIAIQLVNVLNRKNCKIVLVESCTAGLAAALMGGVPGVSDYLCGSIVAYQDEFKSTWLEIDPSLIERYTSVSQPVTKRLAEKAIAATPFADVSCAITGHLGPNAPPETDGTVFVAVANRTEGTIAEFEHRLAAVERADRQPEAAGYMLQKLAETIG